MISQRELEKPTRVDLREITPFSMKMKTRKTFLLVVKVLTSNILLILKILLRHFWLEIQLKDSVILMTPMKF